MEAGELVGAALASRPDAENLIIRPGFLSAGVVYRVRLTATLIGTGVAAQSELTFAVNIPPSNGSAFVTYLRNDYGLPRQMSCRTPSFREFIGG